MYKPLDRQAKHSRKIFNQIVMKKYIQMMDVALPTDQSGKTTKQNPQKKKKN